NGQIKDERLMFSELDLDAKSKGGEQTATVNMFAPIHIGSRQLPVERWTTTPLFRLDYANAAAQKRPSPIRVTFEKAEFDDEDSETSEDKLRREALREAFEITEVEDGIGDGMKNTDIRLKLHTLGFDDEYWIDTGVFQY
ncbi:MAG: virulence factor SrfB, partial [Albidovulum sp.]